MRISGKFLAERDILRLPVEKEGQAHINTADKYGRVKNRLPGGCRAEDRSAAKHKEEDLRRGFD